MGLLNGGGGLIFGGGGHIRGMKKCFFNDEIKIMYLKNELKL